MQGVDLELQSQVAPELQPGEKLLWIGRPGPLRYATRDTYLVLAAVGIIVIGVLIMLIFFAIWGSIPFEDIGMKNPFPPLMDGFWLVLLLVACIIFAPFVMDYLRARHMLYAVTDQRLIILRQPALWWGQVLQSFRASDIKELTRQVGRDGSGDLLFSREYYGLRTRLGTRIRSHSVGFFGIPDAQQVEQIINRTFKQPVGQ